MERDGYTIHNSPACTGQVSQTLFCGYAAGLITCFAYFGQQCVTGSDEMSLQEVKPEKVKEERAPAPEAEVEQRPAKKQRSAGNNNEIVVCEVSSR